MKKKLCKCVICGDYTTFSLNICEDCFNIELDYYYSDDRKDIEE